jgi:hypothetical protein
MFSMNRGVQRREKMTPSVLNREKKKIFTLL